MNTLIRLQKTTPVFVIAFVLAWFALTPTAQAVVPPPDGGYPNFNTAEGQKALFSLTTGSANTAVGWYSLFSDTTGSFNTATGAGTLLFNTDGDANTAFGAAALLGNGGGGFNTAVGAAALLNSASSDNTAIGARALENTITGFQNTAVGTAALVNRTGDGNTALGAFAGGFITTGINNIHIANSGLPSDTNTIRIGNLGSTKCAIAGIRDVTTTISDAIPVVIDSTFQLGTMSSSRRFKKEIEPMDKASGAILALKPVTFHYKSDATNRPQFGLVAEEVAEVNPDLVVHDKNGEIYTVRYDAVNAMLLNEFLKEHRKNEEQQKQIDLLTAQLREQAALIQKVSAQQEQSKSAPQMVLNNQ